MSDERLACSAGAVDPLKTRSDLRSVADTRLAISPEQVEPNFEFQVLVRQG
jgi:hypothetical protein